MGCENRHQVYFHFRLQYMVNGDREDRDSVEFDFLSTLQATNSICTPSNNRKAVFIFTRGTSPTLYTLLSHAIIGKPTRETKMRIPRKHHKRPHFLAEKKMAPRDKNSSKSDVFMFPSRWADALYVIINELRSFSQLGQLADNRQIFRLGKSVRFEIKINRRNCVIWGRICCNRNGIHRD